MKEDRFYVPVRVFFGRDAVRTHAKDIVGLGKKALIVTGKHSAKKCGVYDDICAALDSVGIGHVLFDEVEENPSAATVMKARDFGLMEQADFVIGAGGGSPMDAAKAIALMIRHCNNGRSYLYAKGEDSSTVPVVCIPTTCGTGSEVTAVSVLTDEVKGKKGSIPHKIFPQIALVDGKYLESASSRMLCNTAFDALSHLYESYLNADAGVISRMIAKDGIREWKKCLPVLRQEKKASKEDYETLMRAAMLGGMAIAHTGTSIPHALSYAMTYGQKIPHGKAVCYFLAGYLQEADPAEVSDILSLAGFTSVPDFHRTYEICCGPIGIEEDTLEYALEKDFEEVISNQAKCAKAPFPITPDILHRIAFYSVHQKQDAACDKECRKVKAVLFDLDGTINDSGPGIMNSVRYALDQMGFPSLKEETLRRFVGPSLVYSFKTFSGMEEEQAWKAVEVYRECYHAGECYNLNIYDGMKELLEELNRAGIRCAVVTSKPQDMSEQILEHFDMTKYFELVAGPDPDDPSNQKSVLIARALRGLNLSAEDVVMVGDTRFDIIGAKEAGCRSIGVTYGYGTKEELVESGADYLVDSPAEIRYIDIIYLN